MDSRPAALQYPYLRGIHDADGDLHRRARRTTIAAFSRNSRVRIHGNGEDAIHYVSAGAYDGFPHTGTYTLSVEEVM